MNDIKIIDFENQNFAKRCSLFPSQLSCFSFSSQLGTEKEHLLKFWNVEYNQTIHHFLKITVYLIIACMFNQFRNNYSHYLLRKLRDDQKRCSSNSTNLQARNDFLKVSKSAGIWWGTPFLGNSSWGALH